MVYVAESQIAYIMSALDTMTRRGVAVVEVTERAQARSNAEIDRRMRTTIWSTGCHSWYIDANGRNSALWPDWTWRFRRRTSRFDADSYRVVQLTTRAVKRHGPPLQFCPTVGGPSGAPDRLRAICCVASYRSAPIVAGPWFVLSGRASVPKIVRLIVAVAAVAALAIVVAACGSSNKSSSSSTTATTTAAARAAARR